MELTVDIPFEQLLRIIDQLPAQQRKKLKALLSKKKSGDAPQEPLDELLLRGPTFTKAQLKRMADVRTAFEKWRKA